MAWTKKLFTEKVTKYTAAVGNNMEEGIEEAKTKAELGVTPGIPGAYESQTANAEHEVPSETTIVYLSIKGKVEATAYEVLIDAKAVHKIAEETLVANSADFNHTLRVKAKGKWEVKVTKGTLAELHSVYQAG